MKNSLEKIKDVSEQKKIKQTIQQMESRKLSKENEMKKSKIKKDWKRSEQALVEKGKNPYYLKQCKFIVIFSTFEEIGTN